MSGLQTTACSTDILVCADRTLQATTEMAYGSFGGFASRQRVAQLLRILRRCAAYLLDAHVRLSVRRVLDRAMRQIEIGERLHEFAAPDHDLFRTSAEPLRGRKQMTKA